MKSNISYQGDLKNAAKIVGRYLPISHKVSREIALFIKNKQIDKALNDLELVTQKKLAVPYKTYKRSIPHRGGGIMTGRYPVKASGEIIKLLSGLKANAENKGLNTSSLIIVHAASQKGPLAWHAGRLRRRRRKINHFEIVAAEKEERKEEKK